MKVKKSVKLIIQNIDKDFKFYPNNWFVKNFFNKLKVFYYFRRCLFKNFPKEFVLIYFIESYFRPIHYRFLEYIYGFILLSFNLKSRFKELSIGTTQIKIKYFGRLNWWSYLKLCKKLENENFSILKIIELYENKNGPASGKHPDLKLLVELMNPYSKYYFNFLKYSLKMINTL